ncbi:uncharacterized protein LOC114574555, partial [Exaiptasia diaphana]|uniref:Uncharacterized protein n=1 Tax=Exaiptasia diaphana TaxID=2652724 RepID=A0A913YE45_EXADI
MLSEVIAGLLALIVENCTGVTLLKKSHSREELEDKESSLIRVEIEETLHDFKRFDPNDVTFREYDPPVDQEQDPQAWRKNVASLKEIILKSIGNVFVIQAVCGLCIGLLAIIFVWIQMNTAFVCYFQNYQVPHKILAIKVTTHAVEGFLIELSHSFVLATVFSWQQLKSLYIPFITIVVGLLDFVYEISMFAVGLWGGIWVNFPLYFLFTVMIVTNSTILARHYRSFPSKWIKTMALSFTFCAQFFFCVSLIVFYCHTFWPWYYKQTTYTKVITAALSPLITYFPKLVCRLAAQKLSDVHPGSAHAFVDVIYGGSAMVYRVMQAELSSFALFAILGVIHGFLDLLERLTATMRDHIWEYLYRLLRCKRKRMSKYRSPRSRRFVADMSIQILLQEGAGLVVSLGIIHL